MTKVNKMKYIKENAKDPTICKMCGKKQPGGVFDLVGGICMPCHSKANIRDKEDRKGFDGSTLLGAKPVEKK